MPLPCLNPTTLEPNGVSLPLADYFNPTKNVYFQSVWPSGHRFVRNYVNINDIKKVSQALLTADSIDELISPIILQFSTSGSGVAYYPNFVRLVFDTLPDDKKFLAFYLNIRTGQAITNGHRFTINFRVPTAVSYNEVVTGLVTVPFSTTTIDLLNYAPNEEQKQLFTTDLLEALPRIMAYWDSISPNSMIYSGDNSIPWIVKHTLQFIADRPVFNPEGSAEEFPFSIDYYSPSSLLRLMDEGHRIKFGMSRNFSKLTYTATYAAGDRGRLGRIMNYSTNVLTVLPYIIKGPKEAAAPTYGVELESCSDYTPRQMVDAQKDLFFIMKQDGSISGSKPQKYEIVTVPATLKAHKRLWAELFEKIDYNNFDTTKNTGNGMHVHIGRSFFTRQHLNRFTWFITNPANFEFMFTVSERPNKNDFARWAPMPFYDAYRSKHMAAKNSVSAAADLRGSVHFKGSATVEVRMFKGIVSYATIIKNLEFVDSVFHFTQNTNLSQLTLKNYLSWLGATEKNRYQTLKTFFSEVNTKDLVSNAEVQDYLWMESQDHLIAEKLNKAPFKVTNTHITALNKRRRSRAFILKNGEVICVRSNGGLLAKLDKSLSKKQTRGAATFTMTEFAA